MSKTVLVFVLSLFPITALAQEATRPSCPPVVEIPSRELVEEFRACGNEQVAAEYERMLTPPPSTSAPASPVAAPDPPPATAAETAAPTAPHLPYIGEGTAGMSGGGGVPMVTALPGFLHRRPVPWSPHRGLRLWNGLNCDGDFSFAIEVRVDGRVVIPTEMGNAWPQIPVTDSAGRRSTAYLVPQGRDRTSGGYVYIPVGGGSHDVEVTVYDAPLGMIPMRLGGGHFTFNPLHGDLHQLHWYEVSTSDGGWCGAR